MTFNHVGINMLNMPGGRKETGALQTFTWMAAGTGLKVLSILSFSEMSSSVLNVEFILQGCCDQGENTSHGRQVNISAIAKS